MCSPLHYSYTQFLCARIEVCPHLQLPYISPPIYPQNPIDTLRPTMYAPRMTCRTCGASAPLLRVPTVNLPNAGVNALLPLHAPTFVWLCPTHYMETR